MSRNAPVHHEQDRYRRYPELSHGDTNLRSPRSFRSSRRARPNTRGMSRDVVHAANSFMESVGEIAKCITHRDTLRKLYTITVSRWWDPSNRLDIPRFNDVLYHICYGMQAARVKRDTFVEWKCSRERPAYASSDSRSRLGSRNSYSRSSRVDSECKRESSRDAPLHRNRSPEIQQHPDESRREFSETPRFNETRLSYNTEEPDSNPSRKRRRTDRSRDASPGDDPQSRRVCRNASGADNPSDESDQ